MWFNKFLRLYLVFSPEINKRRSSSKTVFGGMEEDSKTIFSTFLVSTCYLHQISLQCMQETNSALAPMAIQPFYKDHVKMTLDAQNVI